MQSPEDAPRALPKLKLKLNMLLEPVTPVMFASTYPADMASESEYFGYVVWEGTVGVGDDGKFGVDVDGEGVVDQGKGVAVGVGVWSRKLRTGTATMRK